MNHSLQQELSFSWTVYIKVAFYRKYGFEPCPGLQLHLMLLMKDLRAALGV